MLLAHPEAEDLGRFVEGTLDDPERTAIVQHIADCDDCRVLVVDAAEFIEPAKKESHSNWWMGIAASLMLVAAIGTLTYRQFSDPLADVKGASARLPSRLVESRFDHFGYVVHTANRGGGDGEADPHETDPRVLDLEGKLAEVLERSGDSPKLLHARGVARLLNAATATPQDHIDVSGERREAITSLEAAAAREPRNAGYQNDVAAALLATGVPKDSDLAISYLDKALAIDARNPEALFNRALALRDRNPKEAIAAFNRYLAVDSSSKWADEARRDIENLEILQD